MLRGNAWMGLESIGKTALVTITTALTLMAISARSAEKGESVQVSSVQVYPARQIETGDIVGHFLHIQANVMMSAMTKEQLTELRAVPVFLVARLEVNDRPLPQCGVGGYIRQIHLLFPSSSQTSQDPGQPISPLFYSPAGSIGRTAVLELIMVLEEDGRRWAESPVSRARVPWTQELLDVARPAQAAIVSVHTEEVADKNSLNATRLAHVVRLRLPTGLTRVLGWGKSEIHCGAETSDASPSIRISTDLIDVQFASSVDALNCPWEIWFPDIGVKLELEVYES